MRIRFGSVAALAFAASLSTAQAQVDEPIEFAATRYPVRPVLTLNDRPAVCDVLAREVTTRFTVPGRNLDLTVDLRSGEQDGDGWLGFARAPARTGLIGGATVQVLDWDVERDDKQDLLVALRRTLSGTERFELHSVPAALVEVGDAASAISEMFPYARSDARALIDRDGFEVTTAWAEPFLFVRDNELYLYQRESLAFSPTEPSQIVRLGPDGMVDTCRLEILPARAEEGASTFVATPLFDQFVASTRAVLGSPDVCPSSSAGLASGYHQAYFSQSIWEIRFRPWSFDAGRLATDRGEATLLRWSRTGLWQFRAARELRERRAAALADLAGMYTQAFGLAPADAEMWASRMLAYATASMIQPSEEPIVFEYSALDVKLLEGAAEAEVAGSLPVRYQASATIPEWGSREPDLFFALEHPNLVQLILDRGANVDEPNHFGKTALMYAAHFNLPETARVLLRAGANPNSRTVAKPPFSCNAFERIGRTPLMYAAENADEEMLELLISAGADTTATDFADYYTDGVGQPHDGIADYLARNARFSLEQKQRIEQRWELR